MISLLNEQSIGRGQHVQYKLNKDYYTNNKDYYQNIINAKKGDTNLSSSSSSSKDLITTTITTKEEDKIKSDLITIQNMISKALYEYSGETVNFMTMFNWYKESLFITSMEQIIEYMSSLKTGLENKDCITINSRNKISSLIKDIITGNYYAYKPKLKKEYYPNSLTQEETYKLEKGASAISWIDRLIKDKQEQILEQFYNFLLNRQTKSSKALLSKLIQDTEEDPKDTYWEQFACLNNSEYMHTLLVELSKFLNDNDLLKDPVDDNF